MNNSIATINDFNSLQPVGLSHSTGMNIYQSFQANSGFLYQVGARDLNGLLIIEGVAEGTACIYLCGIQVRDRESGQEICNITVERNTHYSRQLVMQLVHKHLCRAIFEAAKKEGRVVSNFEVEEMVANMLDDCYFKASRQAALSWAERVGII